LWTIGESSKPGLIYLCKKIRSAFPQENHFFPQKALLFPTFKDKEKPKLKPNYKTNLKKFLMFPSFFKNQQTAPSQEMPDSTYKHYLILLILLLKTF
jgi:hypothetical protein